MNTALSRQNMADMITAVAAELPSAKARVLHLYVREMETGVWYPGAWQDAMNAAGGLLTFEADGVHVRGASVFDALLELFDRYWTLAGVDPLQPPQPPQRLTLAQAADYLRVSVPTMKKYVYRDQRVAGEIVGGVLWFDPADLDRFDATRSNASRAARERAARERAAGDPD